MKRHFFPSSVGRNLALLGLAFLLAGTRTWAQWATQTLQLSPGWNAVFLEVQPEPRDCDVVLAGLPVESVWQFNRRFTPAQFLLSTNQPITNPEDWLVWVPASHPLASRQSLFILEGGKTYLVRTTNATEVTWTMRGTPVVRPTAWLADSLNLVGFGLPATSPPTFASFFAGARNLAPGPLIQRLSTDGTWIQVAAATTMRPGEAFWIRTQGLPDASGPLKVTLARRTGLDFGRLLTEDTVQIRNDSDAAATVLVRQVASEPPPATGTFPAYAAGVPLSYWLNDFNGGHVGWSPLVENGAALVRTNLAPGSTWEIRLAVRRQDMDPAPAATDPPGVLYQSLLEVRDAGGRCRQLIPVCAEGLGGGAGTVARAGRVRSGGDDVSHPHAGLWIGSASIRSVNRPSSGTPDEPVPVASEFQFRLLVHVDSSGQARLLQKVLQMWKPGTYKPAGDGSTNRVVDQPGRFVLATDESLVSGLTGAAIRDGRSVGRRFSSAAFGFREPIPLTGSGEFGVDQAAVEGDVLVAYNDPENPFVHGYHPDHDNLNDRKEPLSVRTDARGRSTAESFDVTRRVRLEFAAEDPDQLTLAGWGDNQLGGVYRERISGLHKNDLYLRGTFRLHRASEVAVLNDGN